MTAVLNHFLFEFRTGVRNKQLLLMNYLFPLGFYLMMGFIMPAINPLFKEVLIPAMVVFAILASSLLGMPDPLVNARERGIFRSYKINGVPVGSILGIPSLTTFLHLVVVVLLITFSAPALFDAPLPQDWLGYAATVGALSLACLGLGVLIGVISPSSRMTVLWSQIIFVPSMLIGGMMIPYSMLPQAVGKIAHLLPATQAMNAFNGLAMGASADFNPYGSLIALACSGLLGFALSIYLFSWDRHNAKRRGHPLLALLVLLPYVIGMLLV